MLGPISLQAALPCSAFKSRIVEYLIFFTLKAPSRSRDDRKIISFLNFHVKISLFSMGRFEGFRMTADSKPKISTIIIAAVVVLAALGYGKDVFAPLTLALFIIAVVWPLQQRLQSRLPALVALAITVVMTVVVCLAFASLAAWAFGRVGRSLVADAPRYQTLYDAALIWLEDRGVSVAGFWAEHFNSGWLLRAARQVSGRINTTLSFWLVTFVYVMLGLLEVDDMRQKVQALSNQDAARIVVDGSAATANKFRKYMLIRTQMSVVTGLLVWALAWVAGQFATEWGIIAFSTTFRLSVLSSRRCFPPCSR
jgi:AI-2 transport protein TqsA